MSSKLKKIELETYSYSGDASGIIQLSKSLPYFKSKNTNSKYFHRVRRAARHRCLGKVHYSVHFWCGGSGFIGKKGALYAEFPPNGLLCATCEGRAIGAGKNGSRLINGRFVMYKPRDNKGVNNEENS